MDEDHGGRIGYRIRDRHAVHRGAGGVSCSKNRDAGNWWSTRRHIPVSKRPPLALRARLLNRTNEPRPFFALARGSGGYLQGSAPTRSISGLALETRPSLD